MLAALTGATGALFDGFATEVADKQLLKSDTLTTNANIAQVVIEHAPAHLSYPLDYLIPDKLVDKVLFGSCVRVRLNHRLVTGWVVGLSNTTDFRGRLLPIERCLTPIPTLTTSVWNVCQQLGKRIACAPADFLPHAIAPRHVATMKRLLCADKEIIAAKPANPASCDSHKIAAENNCLHTRWWECATDGLAGIKKLRSGERTCIVADLLPTEHELTWVYLFADVVFTQLNLRRSAIIVVPTQKQVDIASRVLTELAIEYDVLTSATSVAEQNRIHLQALSGNISVVIGTRSAIWTPLMNLGAICIWQYEDDRLWPQQHPRVDALTIAIARAQQEGASLICASWVRSVRGELLCRSGYARSLEPVQLAKKQILSRIEFPSENEYARAASVGNIAFPDSAFELLRQTKENGGTLVIVPRSGYAGAVACIKCGKIGLCSRCETKLILTDINTVSCKKCGIAEPIPSCDCGGSIKKALRTGANRVTADIARAFRHDQVQCFTGEVVDSDAAIVVTTINEIHLLNRTFGGCLILEGDYLSRNGQLWAEHETLERIEEAASRVSKGGRILVIGAPSKIISVAQRKQYASWARQKLAEYEAIGLWPTRRVIELSGDLANVTDVSNAIRNAINCSNANAGAESVLSGDRIDEAGNTVVTLAIDLRYAGVATQTLWEYRRQASARGTSMITYRIDPRSL